MAGIEFLNVSKSYQVEGRTVPVLKGLSLLAEAGQIMAVLGRSGCGKTTLLRLAGGLEMADAGEIRFLGPARTAFVFQEPRLMPWLNVRRNVAFGVKEREAKGEAADRLIRMAGLEGFEGAYPSQLSGGMKQRAAIARALAYEPSFILMDEPFAALDHFTREQMQRELLRIQREEGCGILFVTHSIDEALILGDQIVVIREGQVKAQYRGRAGQGQSGLLEEDMIGLKRKILESLEG